MAQAYVDWKEFADFREKNSDEHATARTQIEHLQRQVADLDGRVRINTRWLYILMTANLAVGGTGAVTGIAGLAGS